ncbi:MAG: hypothetical protein HY893_03870 [Deltaproteobacteria bacterium]|nr:hypothetical protein [Deltaproteobacteria bacterium]
MKTSRIILWAVIALSLIIITGVSWHSVEEIHYLKTFYPPSFTVEEAFYATLVEFIKVHIISLPLVVIIVLSLYLLRAYRQ